MTRYWLVRYLFSPSIVSGTICAVLAAGATIAIAWSYIANNQLFYGFLFGSKGAATALITASDSRGALEATLFSSQITYYALLVAVAVATGFIVYAVLQGASGAFRRTKTMVRRLRAKDALAKTVLDEILLRLATRTFSLFGLAIYVGFFINVLLPFCAILVNRGTADIAESTTSGWWFVLAGFGLVLIGLHLHVVFARMVMLKPRLFSSNDVPIYE